MSTSTKKASKESKFSRCMKAPIRILSRARNLYMQSVSDCAGKVSSGPYGSFMGCPQPQISTLPKSFSTNSSVSGKDEDLRELIRVASTRSVGKKIDLGLLRQQQERKSPIAAVDVVPRSQSVATARIDEDKPCEFGEDIKLTPDFYPRSRSYAVTNRRVY